MTSKWTTGCPMLVPFCAGSPALGRHEPRKVDRAPACDSSGRTRLSYAPAHRGSARHPLRGAVLRSRGGPGQALVGARGHLRGDVHQRDGHDDRERRAAGHVERPRRRHRRAAVGAPLGLRWLPESRRPGAPPLDVPGAALSTVALTGIVFALIEGVDAGWTSPAVLCAAAAGIAAGVAFFAVELRRAHPLFDVRVLVRPRVAVGAFAIFAAYIASLGMLFLLPQHVQYVQDGSALASGLELASFGVGLGALAPVGGRLVGRYGPRVVLLAGLLTATAGFVPLLLLSGDSSPALLVLGTGIVGCGLGLTVPPATAVIMNDLGLEKAGDGAAVNQLARQVGGALGVAIVGSVFAAIYAAEVADDRVPPAPKESNQGKTDLASRLHGAARVDLLHDAVTSFDVAARWGLAVCMAAVLLSAASAAIGLTGVTRAKR